MAAHELKFRGNLNFESVITHRAELVAAVGDTCIIDLDQVTFARPCGMASLAALVEHLVREKVQMFFRATESVAFPYMQNMNLFGLLGAYTEENFNRRPQAGRFCRMGRVDFEVETTKLAREMLETVQIADPAVRADVANCLDESLSNLHSHARGPGYAVAQSFRRPYPNAWYELAICDCGRGIRPSLSEAYLLHNDKDALDLACQYGTSRCLGQADSGHYGLGLWQIDRIVETTGGIFTLCSGTSKRVRNGAVVSYAEIPAWQGTIIALRLTKAGIAAAKPIVAGRRLRHG